MEARSEIQAHEADLVVFFNAHPDIVSAWFAQSDLPPDLPVVADPEATLYEALGAPHVSWRRLLMWPGSVKATREARRAGYRARATKADMQRLGADVVVDAGGEIRFLHVAANPADRAGPDRLVAEVAALSG